MALGMIDVWSLASTQLAMHTAVQAGAKYLVQGGSGESNVTAIVNATWAAPPSGHNVNVTKACACSGAAADCSSYCATNYPPTITYTLTASGSWVAPFHADFLTLTQTVTDSQVVRVR